MFSASFLSFSLQGPFVSVSPRLHLRLSLISLAFSFHPPLSPPRVLTFPLPLPISSRQDHSGTCPSFFPPCLPAPSFIYTKPPSTTTYTHTQAQAHTLNSLPLKLLLLPLLLLLSHLLLQLSLMLLQLLLLLLLLLLLYKSSSSCVFCWEWEWGGKRRRVSAKNRRFPQRHIRTGHKKETSKPRRGQIQRHKR